MAYVSIDPEGVDALITQNNTWAKSVTESSSSITAKNSQEGSPCSLMRISMMAGFKQNRIPVRSWVEFSAGAV